MVEPASELLEHVVQAEVLNFPLDKENSLFMQAPGRTKSRFSGERPPGIDIASCSFPSAHADELWPCHSDCLRGLLRVLLLSRSSWPKSRSVSFSTYLIERGSASDVLIRPQLKSTEKWKHSKRCQKRWPEN